MHMRETPEPPSMKDARLPPIWNAVFLRCLRKDPARVFGAATSCKKSGTRSCERHAMSSPRLVLYAFLAFVRVVPGVSRWPRNARSYE